MEISRNTPAGDRPKAQRVDPTRTQRDGIDRTSQAQSLETAARARVVRATPGDPSAVEPDTANAPALQDAAAPSKLALQVGDRMSQVREEAIAERVRERRGDAVELSDTAYRIGADLEQRELRVRELRREYLSGRLITGARLEQAARGLLGAEG